VTGCVASFREREIRTVAKNSIISISKGYEPIDERVEKLREELSKILTVRDEMLKHSYGVAAYVPVIFGCDSFCTYCIVPAAKGRERSRNLNDILSEVRNLVQMGTKEIILLGQNINHYGSDFGNEDGFIELLEAVNDVNGLERLRYLTPHPAYFSLELVYRMSKLNTLMPHFHLPVQSGSNKFCLL